MKRILTSILILLIPLVSFGAPSIKIVSDAFEGKVEVDETFHITIEATDCTSPVDMSKLPPGVKVVYHTTNQISKSSMVNGKMTSTHTTSLILTCKGQTVGKYSFGPVSIDGVKSNTVSYQVVAATGNKNQKSRQNSGSSAIDQNSGPLFIGKGNEEMYLKAYVNKTSAYEQEAIEYTVKLYTTYGDIKFLGAAAAPKFDGFVVEESSDVSKSFSFEDVGGKTFKTAIIARYIIFPQKAGRLKISGNTYTVSTDARQYYHDPYFQTITVKQPVQLNVTPNDVEISVKELPSPVPTGFIGGVGHFKVSSSLPSATLTSNTAASVIYTIEGEGNIKYVKIPDIASYFPNSFEIYSPTVSTDAEVDGATIKGTAKFDYSFIPRETGDFTIPRLNLFYFDPSQGEYKPLQTQSYEVSVGLGQSSSKSQQALTFNSGLLPVGTISLKAGEPYIYTVLYWLWYFVPMLIFMFALIQYRKYLDKHSDMVMFRSRNANKMALKRLAKAYQALKNHKEEEFYDEMLASLWGYLADKLRIPTSELNRNNVGDEFKKHGVKEATFMPIINLIDECEYAKYTPVSRDANMRQLYADALESLSNVENEYDKEKGISREDGEEDTSYQDNYINTTESSSKEN